MKRKKTFVLSDESLELLSDLCQSLVDENGESLTQSDVVEQALWRLGDHIMEMVPEDDEKSMEN